MVFFLAVLVLIFFFFFYHPRLTVKPAPPESQVFLDGEPLSRPNFNLKTKPGKHVLRVESPGFIAFAKELDLSIGQKLELSPVLKRLPEAKIILPYEVEFLTDDKDRRSLIYLSDQGRAFFRISEVTDEAETELSDLRRAIRLTPSVLSELKNITFSPDRGLAVLEKTGRRFSLYDFARYDLLSQTETPLPTGISSISFSPDGERLAYFFNPPGEKSLIISDKLGHNAVRQLPRFDLFVEPTISWSKDGKKIVLVNRTQDQAQNNVFLYDLFSKDLKQLTTDGNHLEAVFSPDSQKILFSSLDRSSPDPNPFSKLEVMDQNGENRRSLETFARIGLETTFVGENELLILGPKNEIKSVNLSNFEEKVYLSLAIAGRISQPLVSSDKKRLFFVSQKKIHELLLDTASYQ